MRKFGSQVGSQLRAGDFVVLNGDLGAGKTTFTQGVAEGLGVPGKVTSPTFVVSRIHKPNANGIELIHVDAYRLTGTNQLLDLDLEDHPNSVLIMEWGSSFISALTDEWLQIDIEWDHEISAKDPSSGSRIVTVTKNGDRWETLNLKEFK